MTDPLSWGTHEVPNDRSLSASFGPLALRLRRAYGELRARVGDSGDDEAGEKGWTRWAAADVEQISLTPRFPDRPVVVSPEDPFWLLAGTEALIYVRVPVQVHVEGVGRARHDLLRVPTVVLSDTWWGTLEEGELCYWLETRARRAIGPADLVSHLVVCPLHLINESDEPLHVEKIALRVAYLTIYRAGEGLWSDQTRVLYTGDVEGSRLEMEGRPPREAADPVLLSPPERIAAGGLRARTFRRFRSIKGLMG